MLDRLQRARHQHARRGSRLMWGARRNWALGIASLVCLPLVWAQSTSADSASLTRAACARASEQWAGKAERYSETLKVLLFQTRDNPTEQAQRLDELAQAHASFRQQAQASIAPLGDTPEAQSIDREVQSWMIQQLLPLAQERAGQDKLYFKFFLNNRCKQQFGLP